MPRSIFVGTTCGATQYLRDWAAGVRKLCPEKVLIAVDDDRSQPLPRNLQCTTLHYRSGVAWESYEARHKKWISDFSIGLGIRFLIRSFLESDCTCFLCIDSDVILDPKLIKRILELDFDYLKIGVPGRTREGLRLVCLHWESTNFGIDKRIASRLYPMMNYSVESSYPVDLRLHRQIEVLRPINRRMIQSPYLIHYINIGNKARKVIGLEGRVLDIFDRQIMRLYDGLRSSPSKD